MKRTTYIIIAMMTGALLLAFATIGYIASTKRDYVADMDIIVGGDPVCQSLGDFSKVRITETEQGIVSRYIKREIDIVIERDSLVAEPSISFAGDWAEYLTFDVGDGELCINFDLIKMLTGKKAEKITVQSVSDIVIRVPRPVKTINSQARNIDVKVSNFNCDSLAYSAPARLYVQNSRIANLDLVKCYSSFFNNSSIGTITCDLSEVCGDWNCDAESMIDKIVSNGSPGYGDHANLKDTNFKEFYWTPSGSDQMTMKINVVDAVKVTPQ